MLNLRDPEKGSYPTVLADWLELAVLKDPSHTTTILSLRDLIDFEEAEDTQTPDPAEYEGPLDYADLASVDLQKFDAEIEQIIQEVLGEIEFRAHSLDESYPFIISDDGYSLELKTDRPFGADVYIFCLAMSNSSLKGLIEDLDGAAFITNVERDLFQICATLCAAGKNQGPAISIGHPRPDSTPFLQKMQTTHAHFHPIIIIRNTPPFGAPPKVKDGGIDVISWTPEADGHGGISYYLGQAASGHDWRTKSADTEIEQFCNLWYDTRPHRPRPQMFIPFCVTADFSDDDRRESFRKCVEKEIDTQARILGELYYRYRLPQYANDALSLPANIRNNVERIDEAGTISEWVNEFIDKASA